MKPNEDLTIRLVVAAAVVALICTLMSLFILWASAANDNAMAQDEVTLKEMVSTDD